MNQGLFKLIFNRRTGMLTPTWEGAPAQGKQSTAARACVLTLSLLFFAQPVLANPTGATVVNGTVGFASNGNTLSITNSPNSIINWKSFSINKDEITRFIQQNGASAVLNRITGQDPSKILGTLQSNGRVFIINPNGIVFGQGANIDVAGLVASTLKMSDADFLSGKYNFTDGANAGAIKNEGTINSAIGGQVYLIAPDITNNGIITSPKGEIVLAAGHSVSLVDPKNPEIVVSLTAPAAQAVNVGQLISEGGSIGIYAGLVNQAGIVNANSASVDASGRIFLKGTQSTTLAAGSVTSASNSAGSGGEITVTSGTSTIITAGASIEANAGQNGNGGKVTVWSDGGTQFDGKISAQGGAQSGNGGFVETSAQHVSIGDTARVTTHAANGKSGTWLIDPSDFTIAASGGDITGATLSSNLAGGDVLIQSSSGANTMGNGDIYVNDAVSWSANNLTLTAAHDINVNAVMTASGTSTLTLNTATANGADAAVAGGTVRMGFNPDGTFKGRVDFPGRAGTGFLTINGGAYTVINSLGVEGSTTTTDLQGMNGDSLGLYALGSDIDASATAGFGMGFAPVFLGCDGACGAFDGLGHTISNLTINRPTTDNVGLFSNLDGAAIGNVGLVNASVVGQNYVGALVGYSYGSIVGSFASGNVTSGNGANNIGGLVGFLGANGSIDSSHASAMVTVGTNSNIVGGLVGYSDLSSPTVFGHVTNSYATGTVSAGDGSQVVGGLVAENHGWVINSYASGDVTVGTGAQFVGGLDGFNFGLVDQSYATGKVQVGDMAMFVGGLVGKNYLSQITNSNATGAVVAGNNATNIGGLAGSNEGATIDNSYATGAVTAVSSSSNIGGLVGLNSDSTISSSYATGNVSAVASNYIGGLAGLNEGGAYGGMISDSYSTGMVSGLGVSQYVGGLLGENSYGTVSNSYATGAVIGEDGSGFIGGLVGYNYDTINNNSYATGNVTSGINSHDIGGLVGFNGGTINHYSYATVSDSHASGAVTAGNASYSISAFVGGNDYGGSISNSHSSGAVTAGDNAYDIGGLVGNFSNSFGGGTISKSYATGAVSGGASATDIGGLVGVNYYGTINDSFATGSVSGGATSDMLGGLVGQNLGTINTSFSAGYVAGGAGATNLGGLIGAEAGGTANSYWNTETSGQSTSSGSATGLTTAQMMQSANFVGFDFTQTWTIDAGTSYPYQQALFPNGVQVFSGTVANFTPEVQQAELFIGGTSYGLNSVGANGFHYAFLQSGTAGAGQQFKIDLVNGSKVGTYFGDASAQNTALDFGVGELVNASSNLTLANSTYDLNIRNLGTINLDGGLTFNGLFTNLGTLNVNADTVFNDFDLLGGSISSTSMTPGNLTINGAFNWSGGSIANIGLLTTTGLSTLSGLYDKTLEGSSWNNSGTVNITDGALFMLQGNNPQTFTNQVGGTVNITSTASYPITSENGTERFVNAGTLNYNSGGTGYLDAVFENTGTLNVTPGSMSTLVLSNSSANDGTINIGDTSTLRLNSGYTNNGILMGKGTIDMGQGTLTNNGSIRPGASPGTLTINGNLVLSSSSILDIELAGTSPGLFDVLNVYGNASLAGAVHALQYAGFRPNVGDSFRFLNATTQSGTFATVASPTAFTVAPSYGTNFAALTVTSLALLVKPPPIDPGLVVDFSALPNTGSGPGANNNAGTSSNGQSTTTFNALLESAPTAAIGSDIGPELYLGEPLTGEKRDARLLCR